MSSLRDSIPTANFMKGFPVLCTKGSGSGGDLVVPSRLLVRWNPEQPSEDCRETRSGAPTGPFPPETGAPIPGGRDAQELKNNRERPPRNPRACSGRRPTATLATRDVPTRERRHPDRGAHRGAGQLASATPPAEWRSGGGRRRGKQRRRRSLPEAHQASRGAKGAKPAYAGFLVVWRPGDGAGSNISASLCISSLWRRGRATDSERERSLLHLPVGTGLGGQGRRSGSPRRDRTTGRDRFAPPPTRPERTNGDPA
jgi:hypothetical protein